MFQKNNIIKFPGTPSKLERQVEAILFAASEPLDLETIEKRLQTNSNIKKRLLFLGRNLIIFNPFACTTEIRTRRTNK